MSKRFICILFFFISVNISFGNIPEKREYFAKVTFPDFVSEAVKKCFFQDYRGFLWIGTEDGLIKWDGRQALTFHNNEVESRRVIGNDIHQIIEDKEDKNFIWVLANEGICKISVVSNQVVKRYPNGVKHGNYEMKTSTKFIQSGNFLWMGNYATICGLNLKDGIIKYPIDGNDNKAMVFNNFTDLLFRDNNWVLGFFRNQDFVILDANSGDVILKSNLSLSNFPENFYNRKFLSIKKTGNNHYSLITTMGIFKLELGKKGRIEISISPEFIFPQVYGLFFEALQIDDNQFYLAGERGVFKLYANDFRMEKLLDYQRLGKEDWTSSVSCLIKDKDANIWFGTTSGIYVFNPKKQIAQNFRRSTDSEESLNRLYHIFPFKKDQTIVGANSGLHLVNHNSGSIRNLFNDGAYFFTDSFYQQYFITSNINGSFLFSEHGTKKLPSNLFKELAPLDSDPINDIVRVDDKNWLIASEIGNGLYWWNRKKNSYRKIEKDKYGNSFLSEVFNGIKKLPGNRVLLLCEFEFSIYDFDEDSIKNFRHILEGTDNRMGLLMDALQMGNDYWFACYGNGLVKCNSDFKPVKFFSQSHGLSNQAVYRMEKVDENSFVLSSNAGLFLMNIKTEKLTPIYESDGLVSDQYEEGAGTSKFDRIYMGGYDGLSIIDRAALQISEPKPLIYLNTVQFSKDAKIQTATFANNKFVIPSNPDEIDLSLNIVDFFTASTDSIEYRIMPYQKNWQKKAAQNNLNLIGIPHGEYVLELRAKKKFSGFSEVVTCTFVIQPAWYQTTWFYLFCLFTAAAIAYRLYRLRIEQLQKEFRFKEKIAADLHDDLGSTIMGIKMFTELGVSTGSPQYYTPVKQGLTDAALALREMIWVLDNKTNSAADILRKIETNSLPLLKEKGILFALTYDTGLDRIMLKTDEKRDLYLLLKEFVNNSVKYAECSNISLHATIKGKRMQIELSDNGKGFDIQTVNHGNGLHNMEMRAKQSNYDLRLTSESGKGTTIILRPK